MLRSMKPVRTGLCALGFSFLLSSNLPADPGTAFTYQGFLEDGGVPITSTVSLRFTLFDVADAGNSVGSPLTFDPVAVTRGVVVQELDFGNVFNGSARWLSIEVDMDGGADSFVLLNGRIELLPVPYAMAARTALDDDDRNSSNELQHLQLAGATLSLTDSAVSVDLSTLAGNTFGDGHSLDAADGDPVDALVVDNEGNVGIGTMSPSAPLHVSRPPADPEFKTVFTFGPNRGFNLVLPDNTTIADFVPPEYMSKAGNYIFGVNPPYFSIYDVSNPTQPVRRAQMEDDPANGIHLLDMRTPAFGNNIVAIPEYIAAFVALIDVSNPKSPVYVHTLDKNNPNRVGGVDIENNILGVATFIDSDASVEISLYDISNPASPVWLNPTNATSSLEYSSCLTIALDQNMAILTGKNTVSGTNAFEIYDIGDPQNPQLLNTVTNGQNGFPNVLGNYPKVILRNGIVTMANYDESSFSIIDVSDPSNPVLLARLQDGVGSFDRLAGLRDFSVEGNNAWLLSDIDHRVTQVDISNPANPVLVRTLKSISDPIAVQGYHDDFVAYSSFELKFAGPDASPQTAIQVDGSLAVSSDLNVDGTVSTGPTLNVNSPSIAQLNLNGEQNSSEFGYSGGSIINFTPSIPGLFQGWIGMVPPDPDIIISNTSFGLVRGGIRLIGDSITLTGNNGDNEFLTVTGKSRFQKSVTIESNLNVQGPVWVDGQSVTVHDNGPVSLTLSADYDNVNESEHPTILFQQDGNAIEFEAGFANGTNDFYLQTKSGATTDIVMLPGSGKVGINDSSPDYPLDVGTDGTNGNGAHVTAGGTWVNGSSRAFKEDFTPVDPQAVLQELVTLPITRWQYKQSDEGEHLGPVAEDFHATFGLGDSSKYISTVDADGVALSAIQGLYQLIEEKNVQLDQQQKEIDELKSELAAIRELLEKQQK